MPEQDANTPQETPEAVLSEIEDYFLAHGQTRAAAIRFIDSTLGPSSWAGVPVQELRRFAERYYEARRRWAARG